ncbi:DRTGG domain-containing protein [Mycoplasmatota bacterium WC44]
MLVKQILRNDNFKLLTDEIGLESSITSMFVSDLLSHVLSKAKQGDILITVQNNMNTVAVASLLELSCIILPDNISIDDLIKQKGEEEGIPILTSHLSAKDIILELYRVGVK